MRKPLNPDWPLPDVRSVDELMNIAVAMEAEAARRYEQLARRVAGRGQAELADLFSRLAGLEREHLHGLEGWAGREGRRHPVPAQFAWQLPETFGDDADERPLDPYLALAVAVRNEERAFVFYTYLAALCAADGALRDRAEALAREELKHVAMLRGMRRRAFHARARRPTRARVRVVEDLRRLAAGLDAGSAEIDRLLAQAFAGSAGAGALTHRLEERASTAAEPGSATLEAARRAGQLRPGVLSPDQVLQLAFGDAGEVLETYLAIADHAATAEVLTQAQDLAQHAVGRLALINGLRAGRGSAAGP